MKTELTETLIRAIQNYAEYYLTVHDQDDLYERMTVLFNLSDDDLNTIGMGWLVPEPEESEEEHEFVFYYTETWTGSFPIIAASEEEAEAKFQKILSEGIDTLKDLEILDCKWCLGEK